MAGIESPELIRSLTVSLGEASAKGFFETLYSEPSVSVRLNPFKRPDSPLPILNGAEQVPWSPYGYILKDRPIFTLHPLFHAGAYYVQDSSAMFVGHLFRKELARFKSEHGDEPIRVLDLCAAPGGKTTDMAASLRESFGDNFLLVANEVMRQRASVLSDNVAIWGDPQVMVCSVDPAAFAQFGGFFDIILADVPCSGEGMFRKDAKALSDWSEEIVNLCASRQRRIIADVWPSLAEGGTLIYSTCTFETAENDDNLIWIAESLDAELCAPQDEFGVRRTRYGHLLIPGEVPGEGQWVGVLHRRGGNRIDRLSTVLAAEMMSVLHPLRYGVHKGEQKGRDFVPAADWALSLAYDRSFCPQVPLDKRTALHFLHRDSINLPDAPLGYNLLTYRSLPLGFVKNLGTRCNNLHPQSRRIRMDIE